MLLHHVMFFWASFLLLLCIAALIVICRRGSEGGISQKPQQALFDFSAGQVEGQKIQQVLTEALSGSATDTEFEQQFRMSIQSATGLDSETAWAWFGRFLMEYRKANEFEASPRRLAERFLADIPRRYGLKDASSEPAQLVK